MYINNQQFYSGDGNMKSDVERSIRNVGRLGRKGMRKTDKEILFLETNDQYFREDDISRLLSPPRISN